MKEKDISACVDENDISLYVGPEGPIVPASIDPVTMKTNPRAKYNIKGSRRAQEIVSGFSDSSDYLRSLVANVTNGEFADSLDYRGLKREGFKIRGVARRILRSKKKS